MRMIFTVVLCLLAPATAFAAGGLKPVTSLQESYARAANVSGFLLVGMRRGDAVGPLDLSRLAIEMPKASGQKVCLEMTTRDASYSGQQTFDGAETQAGPQPFALKSKYAKTLSSYSAVDLSARAELRKDCDSGDSGEVVPVSFAGAGNPNSIFVYLNAQTSAARVNLLSARDAVVATGGCTAIVEGARTAFDRICRFDLSGDAWTKAAKLRISLVGLTGGTDDETYPVALGPAR